MSDDIRANLAASLHSTSMDLSKVAGDLADLGADEEIEKHARILDRIAEEAADGATILRGLALRPARSGA